MKTHELKTVFPFFGLVWDGKKKFELRKNDRDFKAGDILVLKEYDAADNSYSGREVTAKVTLIMTAYEGAITEGWAVLSIDVLAKGYAETIKCPECNMVQKATVHATAPFFTYLHTCENCKHLIMESDWNKVIVKP